MTPKIDVCDHCYRRSCWDGIHVCDQVRNAGLVQKSEAELRQLAVEHPCYYQPFFERHRERAKT